MLSVTRIRKLRERRRFPLPDCALRLPESISPANCAPITNCSADGPRVLRFDVFILSGGPTLPRVSRKGGRKPQDSSVTCRWMLLGSLVACSKIRSELHAFIDSRSGQRLIFIVGRCNEVARCPMEPNPTPTDPRPQPSDPQPQPPLPEVPPRPEPASNPTPQPEVPPDLPNEPGLPTPTA
jgi:hypothetical protein